MRSAEPTMNAWTAAGGVTAESGRHCPPDRNSERNAAVRKTVQPAHSEGSERTTANVNQMTRGNPYL